MIKILEEIRESKRKEFKLLNANMTTMKDVSDRDQLFRDINSISRVISILNGATVNEANRVCPRCNKSLNERIRTNTFCKYCVNAAP